MAVVAGVSNLVLLMSLLWLEKFLTSRVSMAGVPNSMVSMIVLWVEGPMVSMILID